MKSSLSLELPGKLIAVEGLDGSGKSTQLYLLKRWLELRGLKVFFTEWNSSVIVKRATSKGKKGNLIRDICRPSSRKCKTRKRRLLHLREEPPTPQILLEPGEISFG